MNYKEKLKKLNNKKETLKIGQFVTVHPQLHIDPYNRRGQKGKIVNIDSDIITLAFEDGKIGQYLDDTLIESHKEKLKRLLHKEGGPGSGIKGHTTAEDPTQARAPAQKVSKPKTVLKKGQHFVFDDKDDKYHGQKGVILEDTGDDIFHVQLGNGKKIYVDAGRINKESFSKEAYQLDDKKNIDGKEYSVWSVHTSKSVLERIGKEQFDDYKVVLIDDKEMQRDTMGNKVKAPFYVLYVIPKSKKESYKEKLKRLKEHLRDDASEFIQDLKDRGMDPQKILEMFRHAYPAYDHIKDEILIGMIENETFKEKLNKKESIDADICNVLEGDDDEEECFKYISKKYPDKDPSEIKKMIAHYNKVVNEFKEKLKRLNKKENLTLDEVALKKFGKKYRELTDEEKKECNYIYGEWSDDDYDFRSENELKKESYKERLNSLKEIQRYGKVEGRDVFIMDKATKVNAKKGYIIIQDLKTGNSYEVPEKAVKNITTKYPESFKESQRFAVIYKDENGKQTTQEFNDMDSAQKFAKTLGKNLLRVKPVYSFESFKEDHFAFILVEIKWINKSGQTQEDTFVFDKKPNDSEMIEEVKEQDPTVTKIIGVKLPGTNSFTQKALSVMGTALEKYNNKILNKSFKEESTEDVIGYIHDCLLNNPSAGVNEIKNKIKTKYGMDIDTNTISKEINKFNSRESFREKLGKLKEGKYDNKSFAEIKNKLIEEMNYYVNKIKNANNKTELIYAYNELGHDSSVVSNHLNNSKLKEKLQRLKEKLKRLKENNSLDEMVKEGVFGLFMAGWSKDKTRQAMRDTTKRVAKEGGNVPVEKLFKLIDKTIDKVYSKKESYKERLQRLKEGGPGSGIKGHTTAEDPTPVRTPKQAALDGMVKEGVFGLFMAGWPKDKTRKAMRDTTKRVAKDGGNVPVEKLFELIDKTIDKVYSKKESFKEDKIIIQKQSRGGKYRLELIEDNSGYSINDYTNNSLRGSNYLGDKITLQQAKDEFNYSVQSKLQNGIKLESYKEKLKNFKESLTHEQAVEIIRTLPPENNFKFQMMLSEYTKSELEFIRDTAMSFVFKPGLQGQIARRAGNLLTRYIMSLKESYKEKLKRLKEGGPGSGIKGHTTAKDPTPVRTPKQAEPEPSKNKKMSPQSIQTNKDIAKKALKSASESLFGDNYGNGWQSDEEAAKNLIDFAKKITDDPEKQRRLGSLLVYHMYAKAKDDGDSDAYFNWEKKDFKKLGIDMIDNEKESPKWKDIEKIIEESSTKEVNYKDFKNEIDDQLDKKWEGKRNIVKKKTNEIAKKLGIEKQDVEEFLRSMSTEGLEEYSMPGNEDELIEDLKKTSKLRKGTETMSKKVLNLGKQMGVDEEEIKRFIDDEVQTKVYDYLHNWSAYGEKPSKSLDDVWGKLEKGFRTAFKKYKKGDHVQKKDGKWEIIKSKESYKEKLKRLNEGGPGSDSSVLKDAKKYIFKLMRSEEDESKIISLTKNKFPELKDKEIQKLYYEQEQTNADTGDY